MKKHQMVTIALTCDVCHIRLCEHGKSLPSFRVSTYVSEETYEHYCDKHTKVMDDFVKKLKEDYNNE
jgi:hypothetical protein